MFSFLLFFPKYSIPLLSYLLSYLSKSFIELFITKAIFLPQKQTRAEWQIVFYVAAAIYTVGAIFYAVFASGVLQPWATEKYTETLQVQDDTLLEDRSTTNPAQNGWFTFVCLFVFAYLFFKFYTTVFLRGWWIFCV